MLVSTVEGWQGVPTTILRNESFVLGFTDGVIATIRSRNKISILSNEARKNSQNIWMDGNGLSILHSDGGLALSSGSNLSLDAVKMFSLATRVNSDKIAFFSNKTNELTIVNGFGQEVMKRNRSITAIAGCTSSDVLAVAP